MNQTLYIVAVLVLLAGCGTAPYKAQYATASSPVELCQSGVAGRGQWYCEQSTLTAMISPNSDGNYTAYPAGTYNTAQSGVSCAFTVSTTTVIDGSKTCYITLQ
jgi:hypothetical protein